MVNAPVESEISIEQATELFLSAASTSLKSPRPSLVFYGMENAEPTEPNGKMVVGKALTTDLKSAFVAYVDLKAGSLLTPNEYREQMDLLAAELGPFTPELAEALAKTDPLEPVTVGVALKRPDREAILKSLADAYPDFDPVLGRPNTGDEKRDLEIRDALRNAFQESATSATSTWANEAQKRGLRVEFASQLVPLVWVTGFAPVIQSLREDPMVVRVYESGATQPAFDTARLTDQADWSYSNGHRGAGSRIAVVEYDNVNWGATDLGIPTSQRVSYSTTSSKPTDSHPTWVMGTIASTTASRRGISPDAFYISSGTGGYILNQRDFDVMEAVDNAVMASKGNADVVNLSFVQDTSVGKPAMRAYIDEVVRTYLVHVAAAAGNYSYQCSTGNVQSPGTAWNVVTVGGIDDNNTAMWSDDSVGSSSCYVDPSGGTFKPEVSAPAVCVQVTGTTCVSSTGTSISSPQVAAELGNLVGYAPTSLRSWPERTKAIVLAASGRHRTSTDPSGMGDKEGLGDLTTERADLIAEKRVINGYKVGDFGSWTATGSFDGGCYLAPGTHTFTINPEPGRTARLVISWESHGFYTAGAQYGSGDSYSDQRMSDIDLHVKDRFGVTVDLSTSTNNTVEWADWTANSNGPYTVEIDPFSWSCGLPSEVVGWAWGDWPS
jgi:hypothetical protein